MKVIIGCLLVSVFLISQAVAGDSDYLLDLHEFTQNSFIIAGDGVSMIEAERLSKEKGVPVFYGKSRGPLANLIKTSLIHTIGPSKSMKHIITLFHEMNDSDREWSVYITKHARSFVIKMFSVMKDGELSSLKGRFIIPLAYRQDKRFHSEIKRIFGENFGIEYE